MSNTDKIIDKVNLKDDEKYKIDKEAYNRIKQAEKQENLKNFRNLFIGFLAGALCGVGAMVAVYMVSIEPNIMSKSEFETNQLKLLNTQHVKTIKEMERLFYKELQEVDSRIESKEAKENK